MNPDYLEEYLRYYQKREEARGDKLTAENISHQDVLLEIIEMYRGATGKRDKKSTAKFLLKYKDKMESFGLWKYIDDDELMQRIQ